jgi:hypothetical protein
MTLSVLMPINLVTKPAEPPSLHLLHFSVTECLEVRFEASTP